MLKKMRRITITWSHLGKPKLDVGFFILFGNFFFGPNPMHNKQSKEHSKFQYRHFVSCCGINNNGGPLQDSNTTCHLPPACSFISSGGQKPRRRKAKWRNARDDGAVECECPCGRRRGRNGFPPNFFVHFDQNVTALISKTDHPHWREWMVSTIWGHVSGLHRTVLIS